MKKSLLITLILFLSNFCFSQRLEQNFDLQSDVAVKMELVSIFEMNQISSSSIRVANTEAVVLNFCDSYFKLNPGVHQINIEIPENCRIELSEMTADILDMTCKESKILSNALKTIDYFSSQIIRTEDIIEWKFCK